MNNLNDYIGKKLVTLFIDLLDDETLDIELMILVYAYFRNKKRTISCSPWYKALNVLSQDLTDSKILDLTYAHNVTGNDVLLILIDLEQEGG